MAVYYNEFDPFAAEWLRNLMRKGLISDGEIDTRSILDVRPDDLAGFAQCHFFAGIAGWSEALRLAGWDPARPVWTGSCPCQPFSVAGKGKGTADERHLWPAFFRLIAECRPAVVFGEQVASKAGRAWLSGVFADLESVGYAGAGADLCAAGVGAPHIRQRLYWVARAVADAERDGAGHFAGEVADEGRRTVDARAEGIRRGDGSRLSGGADARDQSGVADAESLGRGGRAHDEDEGRREQPSSHPCEGSYHPCEGSSDMANADGGKPGEGRGDDGEVRGFPEAQRQSEHGPALSWRGGEANGSGDVADAASRGQLDTVNNAISTKGMGAFQFEGNSRSGDMADADDARREGRTVHAERPDEFSPWARGVEWRRGADGKERRIGCQIRRVSHGLPPVLDSCGNGRGEETKEEINGWESEASLRQDLSDLRGIVQSDEVHQRCIGGLDAVSGSEVLQHQLRGRPSEREAAGFSSTSEEISGGEVRGMRDDGEPSRSSCRPQPAQQRPVEPSDVVCFLSSETALGDWQDSAEEAVGLQNLWRACEIVGYVPETLSAFPQVWRSMPDEARQRIGRILCEGGLVWEPIPLLTTKQTNRIGLLRGLGNAIVPPLAAEFIKAIM